MVVFLDHEEAVGGILAAIRLLHGRKGGADLPFHRMVSLLLAAAGSFSCVTGGDRILPVVRLKDLEDAKCNTQQRVLVLVHTEIFSQRRNVRLTPWPSCRRRSSSATAGIMALAELLLEVLAGSLAKLI